MNRYFILLLIIFFISGSIASAGGNINRGSWGNVNISQGRKVIVYPTPKPGLQNLHPYNAGTVPGDLEGMQGDVVNNNSGSAMPSDMEDFGSPDASVASTGVEPAIPQVETESNDGLAKVLWFVMGALLVVIILLIAYLVTRKNNINTVPEKV